jgi:hypothetical protein
MFYSLCLEYSFFSFNLKYIQSAIDLIDLPSFSGEISSPTTFEKSAKFLNNFIFLNFEKQFEDSCHLIAENFSFIRQLYFFNLTNKLIENILSSENYELSSKNLFFFQQLIMKF